MLANPSQFVTYANSDGTLMQDLKQPLDYATNRFQISDFSLFYTITNTNHKDVPLSHNVTVITSYRRQMI